MPGEQLLLINPRRRRIKNSRRRRIKNTRRRRRIKNTRRRHVARARHRNPIHRRRVSRRRRRNPFLGGSIVDTVLMPAALGVAGGIVLGVAWNALSSNLPTSITGNSIAEVVAQGAAAAGLGWVTGKVIGNQKGAAVAIGALTVVLYNYVNTTISGTALSGLGKLQMLKPRRIGMGAYLPNQGLGAYSPSLSGISNFNPAPMMAGLGGTMDNPGMSDSMF